MKEKALNLPMGSDFTTGPILPALFRFVLPFLLANLLNSLYNTVDTIIIGQFVGSEGIVAVTTGGKMLNLFTSIGLSFAGGGQILVSQIVGAKRKEEFRSTVGTIFAQMLLASVLAAVTLFAMSRSIVTWMNTPAESFSAALAYLRITCLGLPLIFGYNAVCAVLRGMGDSKGPLVFISIAATFNVVGDIIFVAIIPLGAAGTAIATVMGQGLSLVFSVVSLYRRREHFGFDFKFSSFRIERETLCILLKLSAVMGPYEAVITGTGNSFLSLLGGLLDGVAFRICFSFLFANVLDLGAAGFFLGDALARFGPILVGGLIITAVLGHGTKGYCKADEGR